MTPELHTDFPATWTAQILATPPLIAPARQFTYPHQIAGEEDALARGAMLLNLKPANAANFLATCALGFRDPAMPSGVYTCPHPDDLLAVSGGYAYLIRTTNPTRCLHVDLRPATVILPVPGHGLILLAGFHHIVALDAQGLRWTTARLTWEGLTLGDLRDGKLHGTGWNMPLNRDIPFTVNLADGTHTGGGFHNKG